MSDLYLICPLQWVFAKGLGEGLGDGLGDGLGSSGSHITGQLYLLYKRCGNI